MPHREMTKPFVLFFLVLLYSISSDAGSGYGGGQWPLELHERRDSQF
jgi:hypothetical protein